MFKIRSFKNACEPITDGNSEDGGIVLGSINDNSNECETIHQNVQTISTENQFQVQVQETDKLETCVNSEINLAMLPPETISGTPQSIVANDVSQRQQRGIKKGKKKIVYRSHRGVQTVPSVKSQMLQCFVRNPSIDCRPVEQSDFCSQVSELNVLKMPKFEPDHTADLHSFSKDLFLAVGSFDTDMPTTRFVGQTYKYGISFGPIFPTDFDDTSFHKDILRKADSHRVNFFSESIDAVDVGVVDLLFMNVDNFTNMICKLRKLKLGGRHLVVTAIQGGSSDRKEKATIVFDQNFSSTAFTSYMRAAYWNKPKVEENLLIHNMPDGISAEFLKRLVPDAVQWTEASSGCHRPAVLGLCSKAGGDLITQLFSQIYFNHQLVKLQVKQVCDVPEEMNVGAGEMSVGAREMSGGAGEMSVGDGASHEDDNLIAETGTPELELNKEILGKSRGIQATEKTLSDEEKMEVILHVDEEKNVDEILRRNASKNAGPILTWELDHILKVQTENLSCLSENNPPKAIEILDIVEIASNSKLENLSKDTQPLDNSVSCEKIPGNTQSERITAEKTTPERDTLVNDNDLDYWWNKPYTFDDYHLQSTRTLNVEIDEFNECSRSTYSVREMLILKLRESGNVLKIHKNETRRSMKSMKNNLKGSKVYNIIMEYDRITSVFSACKAVMFSKTIQTAIKELLNFRFCKAKPSPCIWIGNLPLAESRKKEIIEGLDSQLNQLKVNVSQVFVDCISHRALIFCSDIVKNGTLKLLKQNHNFLLIRLEMDFASQLCVSSFITDMLSNGQVVLDDIPEELWGFSGGRKKCMNNTTDSFLVKDNAKESVGGDQLGSCSGTENVSFHHGVSNNKYAHETYEIPANSEHTIYETADITPDQRPRQDELIIQNRVDSSEMINHRLSSDSATCTTQKNNNDKFYQDPLIIQNGVKSYQMSNSNQEYQIPMGHSLYPTCINTIQNNNTSHNRNEDFSRNIHEYNKTGIRIRDDKDHNEQKRFRDQRDMSKKRHIDQKMDKDYEKYSYNKSDTYERDRSNERGSVSKTYRHNERGYGDKSVDRNKDGEHLHSKRPRNHGSEISRRDSCVDTDIDDYKCRYGKWDSIEYSKSTYDNREGHDKWCDNGTESSSEPPKAKQSEVDITELKSLVKDKLIEKLLKKVHSDNATRNVNSPIMNVEPEHHIVMDVLHKKPKLKQTSSN